MIIVNHYNGPQDNENVFNCVARFNLNIQVMSRLIDMFKLVVNFYCYIIARESRENINFFTLNYFCQVRARLISDNDCGLTRCRLLIVEHLVIWCMISLVDYKLYLVYIINIKSGPFSLLSIQIKSKNITDHFLNPQSCSYNIDRKP